MQVRKETILNVFPGADDQHRLVVAVAQVDTSGSTLVLRQESYAEDVGWFVQSRISIEPGQIPGLKMALSGGSEKPVSPRVREIRTEPAILRFSEKIATQAG